MIELISFVFHSLPTFSLTQYSRGLDYYYGTLTKSTHLCALIYFTISLSLNEKSNNYILFDMLRVLLCTPQHFH